MTTTTTFRVLLLGLALGGATQGCSLDRRHLRADASGAGVAAIDEGSAGDGSDIGGSPSTGTAGDAGRGATPGTGSGGDGSSPLVSPPLVDGCADLDTDGVADCKVTLVKNAAFDSDVSGWDFGEGVSFEWDARNALLDSHSGCGLLRVEGGSALLGSALFRAAQCVQVKGGQLVIAYANAWVKAASPGEESAQAELQVSYFDSSDCSGQATGYFATPPSTRTATWTTIQAGDVLSTTTKSVSVELVGVKPNSAKEFLGCYDNVMLKLQPL